jgi:formamidopyrimidine-DNA glycosylase
MPELPEVETIKNYIEPLIINKNFSEVRVLNKKLRIKIPDDFSAQISKCKITKVERKAKYIVISLDNSLSIIIHLGMTGKILAHKEEIPADKHDHVIFTLEKGGYLHFNDVRKFGLITYLKSKDIAQSKFFKHLGIEPLTEEFNGKYLVKIAEGKNIAVKKFIMEQKNVVGVGNIYAAEALFMSHIHPEKPACEISGKKYEEFAQNIKAILKNSIEKGGSTIKDYTLVNGESGYFQNEFNVYGRENKPCKICEKPIKKIIQAGRSTFYCDRCQKKSV